MNIKDAVELLQTEIDNGTIARLAKVHRSEVQAIMYAREMYQQNPRDYGLLMIAAAMNWLAVTGRAEGEGTLK